MAISPVIIPPEPPKGGRGGLLGKIIGGVAGAVAAPFTGGTSLAIGPAVGGAIGEAADPGKAGFEIAGPNVLQTAVKYDPNLQLGLMTNSQEALKTHPGFDSDQARQVFDYLENAKKKIVEKLSLGGI